MAASTTSTSLSWVRPPAQNPQGFLPRRHQRQDLKALHHTPGRCAREQTGDPALHVGPVPNERNGLTRNCVYEVTCSPCGPRYIGSTARPLHERVREHTQSVAQLFANNLRKRSCELADTDHGTQNRRGKHATQRDHRHEAAKN